MSVKPIPPLGETLRLQTLNSLKILDTPQEERFQRIIRLGRRLLDVPIAIFSLVENDSLQFKSWQGMQDDDVPKLGALCDYAFSRDTAFEIEDTRREKNLRKSPVIADGKCLRFFAGSPVRAYDGTVLGALCVFDTKPRRLGADDVELLGELGQMIEGELSSFTMATTDELTKLANRRGFRMIADPMIALCQRAWFSASIALFDLDGLKKINDGVGHEAGDWAIKDFSRLLLKAFRDSDVVARIGGDEFCVLLTNPGTADSTTPLVRFQERVAEYNARGERPFTLEFSAGEVQFDKNRHASIDDVLREADECMYEQKRAKKAAR